MKKKPTIFCLLAEVISARKDIKTTTVIRRKHPVQNETLNYLVNLMPADETRIASIQPRAADKEEKNCLQIASHKKIGKIIIIFHVFSFFP